MPVYNRALLLKMFPLLFANTAFEQILWNQNLRPQKNPWNKDSREWLRL